MTNTSYDLSYFLLAIRLDEITKFFNISNFRAFLFAMNLAHNLCLTQSKLIRDAHPVLKS